MISTIVDGGTPDSRRDYILSLPFSPLNTLHLTPDPASIGIQAIKDLVLTLSLSTATPRLVWIEHAETLTLDGSGALLKVLEEPPANTALYLTCSSASTLLPTIRSRCALHSLTTSSPSTTPTSHLPALKPLFALSSGDRLGHLSDFPSERSELLSYFATLALELHHTIQTTHTTNGLKLLSSLSALTLATHASLKSNVNPNLALTHFLLHLPKTK